jgi:selenide,water dikinase
MGLVHPSRIKRNSDGRAGDRLVLGKPLGVGILSAALKKEHLGDEGYAQMIACTTQLNTPGPALAALAGVHAITDVTGFGLAGHVLEMARGSNTTAVLEMGHIPLVDGVRALASSGFVTGASGRNWAAYGEEVALAQDLGAVDQDLLSDPQTSGGLLVACAPDSVDAVLEIFRQQGFAHASEIGALVPAHHEGLRLQVS